MKIQNKLTLLFTCIVAMLLLALNVYIYSLSKRYSSDDFFKRIKERAFIAANVFLEEDEASQKVYKEFRERYLEKLPDEVIRVYDVQDNPVFISDSAVSYFPKEIIDKTRKEKTFQGKDQHRYLSGICYEDNQGEFVILASVPDHVGDAKLLQLRNVLIVGFFVSVIIVFFMGRFFTKLMLKPVSGIVKQVNTITESNLHLRLNEGNGKDELSELSKTFNDVLSRLENAFELQRSFVANASHELRTPLTSIIGNIEVSLSKERKPEEYKKVLNTVLEEAERLHKMSDGLLDITQADFESTNLKMENIRIDELLEEAKDIVQSQIKDSRFEISFMNMPSNPDDLLVKGNRNLLMIALENLFENAAKFSSNRIVRITLDNSDESMIITITDTGIGIPQKDLDHVAQTFYRAPNARSFVGTGIGLALSRKIILLIHGTLSISSTEGVGTTVTVMLPKMNNS